MALDWTENETPFVLYMSSGRHDLLSRFRGHEGAMLSETKA